MAALNILLMTVLLFLPSTLWAASIDNSPGHFKEWLQTLENDAEGNGISSKTVHGALDYALLDPRVITLDQKQPEAKVHFSEYSQKVLSRARIQEGHRLLKSNTNLLQRVSRQYGVPPEIIVALWGLESFYGKNSGNYSVIDSLMTLAYEGRRADFFRQELMMALVIVDVDKITPSSLRGSWAGAMGECQFMPSTYLRYAVDYDHKGSRNIWGDKEDVLASVAHYLSELGWKSKETWGREVKFNKMPPANEIGLEIHHSLREWAKLGIKLPPKVLQHHADLSASLVMPDGSSGRGFLVYDNFPIIMKWNRSTYFALTVGLLADRIK